MNDTLDANPALATDVAVLPAPVAASPEPRGPSAPAARDRRELAALLAFGCAPFLPLLADHLINLWSRPHYQFFPVVLIAAFVIARQRLQQFGGWQPGYSRAGVVGMSISYLGLVFATVFTSPWAGYVFLLLMLASIAHCLGGPALVRRLAGVGVLLLTMLPPPSNADQDLVLRLKSFATHQAGHVLDIMAVPHLLEGNTIIVPDRSLFVEEACSGIHSLTSVLVVTLIYMVWRQRRWLHSAVVLALAVVWVLAANVIRIVAIAVAQVEYGRDLASGVPHQVLGIVLFLLCAGLVASSDCLVRLFRPGDGPAAIARRASSAPRYSSIRFGWRAAAMTVAVACFGLTLFRVTVIAIDSVRSAPAHLTIEDALMPLQWQSFRREADTVSHSFRKDYTSFGDESDTWHYKGGRWDAHVSIDYPFPGLHRLQSCYSKTGWEVKKVSMLPHERGNYYAVELQHTERGTGRLLYALVTDEGRFYSDTDEPVLSLFERPQALFDLPKPVSPKYQIQVLLSGRGDPPANLTAEAESLFFEAVERFVANLPRLKGGQR